MVRRPRPTRAVKPWEKKITFLMRHYYIYFTVVMGRALVIFI
jgi:hypothetical protein